MLFHHCPDCNSATVTRRRFLAGAGAVGAAAMLPAPAARAQGAKTLIDTHCHMYPPQYMKMQHDYEDARKIPRYPLVDAWSVSKLVELMDQNGVRTAVMSYASTPGLWFDAGAEVAHQAVTEGQEFAAKMRQDHPGRFGVFAPLSMMNVDVTLKEIEHAFDTHQGRRHQPANQLRRQVARRSDVSSRCWRSSTAARPWSTSIRWSAACCGRLSVGAFPAVIEVPHDTTRTVTSLLLSGSFARYPRHQVDILARRRHHPDAGRPHRRVLRQECRRPRSSRRTASWRSSQGSTTTRPTRPRCPRWRRCSSSCRPRRSRTAPTIHTSRSTRTRIWPSSVSPPPTSRPSSTATRCG